MTNDLLRSHVTGAAFHLTLGKTHIAALVHLEEVLAANVSINDQIKAIKAGQPRPPKNPHLGNFTTGAAGLVARGLITHTYVPPRLDISDWSPSAIWQITAAGRLVLQLLREAGIWQEYATNPDAATERAA